MEQETLDDLTRARMSFYQKIMTYTIRYGVLRADYPKTENEIIDLENEMREFIKMGLGLKTIV